jgi:hypothetical protein
MAQSEGPLAPQTVELAPEAQRAQDLGGVLGQEGRGVADALQRVRQLHGNAQHRHLALDGVLHPHLRPAGVGMLGRDARG